MFGSGREDLPDVREWEGGPLECLLVVGRPSRMSRVVGKPSWMCGIGLVALPDGLVALPDVQDWSGGPPGYPGVVCSAFQMSGSGREALSGWSGGPP